MNKFLLSAALIGLLGGSAAAIAQDREHQDERGGRHEERGRQGEQRGAPQAQAPRNEDRERGRNEFRGQERAAPAPNNAMRGGNEFRDQERAAPAPNNAMRGGNEFRRQERAPDNAMRGGRPEFNNAMRQGGRRDFGSVRNFHRNFNASRHFRIGRYRPPPGYFARRWSWGQVLPPAFWARDYWILDFADYDLPPPPFGAVWVRVGDDALLIDQGSGEIIEVDYGIFY